jgi:hypothetical protein
MCEVERATKFNHQILQDYLLIGHLESPQEAFFHKFKSKDKEKSRQILILRAAIKALSPSHDLVGAKLANSSRDHIAAACILQTHTLFNKKGGRRSAAHHTQDMRVSSRTGSGRCLILD